MFMMVPNYNRGLYLEGKSLINELYPIYWAFL